MDLIKRAYKIFSNYNVSEIVNVCTSCCLNEAEVNLLVNLDKSNIDVDLLSTYNDSAQAYDPIIDEFKYFLPRYLELINNFNFPTHSTELSLRNLSFYSKDQWLLDEWKLIDEFSIYFFKKCINTYPIHYEVTPITSIFIMYGLADFELSPFLKIWEENDSIAACIQYKNTVIYDFDWMRKKKMSNAFATKEISQIVSDWIYQPRIQQKFLKKIESIIMEEKDLQIAEKDLEELNWLYDIMILE